MSHFTVDTHLFRELGELLVGRDSTALVELVKNSYDADATQVTVHAENLEDPGHGVIFVRDNGIGMTIEQFENGFLRIASRLKEKGRRVSPRFRRRYTGAKGIGRLAAHKLAGLLEIQSISVDPNTSQVKEGFVATIDWDLIEQVSTLDEVQAQAVRVEQFSPSSAAQGGTVLKLSRLRRSWTEEERISFVREAQSTLPPDFLTKPVVGRLLEEPLLFEEIRQHSGNGQAIVNWQLELGGDFEVGEDYFQAVAEVASWVLEVDATGSSSTFGIAPTQRYARYLPTAERIVRSLQSGAAQGYPKFKARILIREGDWERGSEAAKRWRKSASGVMVYQEGFRVLPYGERGNDWLGIDKRYSERTSRKDRNVSDLFEGIPPEDSSKSYQFLPNRAYLGGVFLTLDQSGGLKMLVNREGFLPDTHFAYIQETMRRGVDFSVRVRSEAKVGQRQKWRNERSAKAREASWTATQRLEHSVETGVSLLRQLRGALSHGNIAKASEYLDSAEKYLKVVPETAKEIRDEQAMVFTLASIGTQMAAFVHEIQSLVGLARSMETTLGRLAEECTDKALRQNIAKLSLAMSELRISLERQAAYVYDVASADARRRRARQSITETFGSAVNLVAHHIERVGISIANKIPAELKSPPMFRAELVAIFSNLLTNAIKAAGQGGCIRASGRRANDDKVVVRVENTGVQVNLGEGENWFKPFASSSANVDPGLGQGMGLGLTITRRMLDDYAADIRFVDPSPGFATCVELTFPA